MLLVLFIVSALSYGAAAFAYGSLAGRDGPAPRYGMALLAFAAALHLCVIGAQCYVGQHPLKSVFLALNFGALVTVAGYLGLLTVRKLEGLGAVVAAVGLIGLSLGVVFSGQGVERIPGTAGIARAHVALATLGVAGFTLAAGVAGLYLGMERRLRAKRFRPGVGGMSLTGLDLLHYRLVLLVTPVFTLAIVTGVLWILGAGGPEMLGGRTVEIVGSVTAWVASVVALVSRAVWGTRGRRFAWLTLLSFVAVVLVVISYGVRGT